MDDGEWNEAIFGSGQTTYRLFSTGAPHYRNDISLLESVQGEYSKVLYSKGWGNSPRNEINGTKFAFFRLIRT